MSTYADAMIELTAEWPDGAWKEGELPGTIIGAVGRWRSEVTLVKAHVNWIAFCSGGKGMGTTPVAAIRAIR